jgi:biopolymer transport protein ExbD/biopolymer transport protein TolR
MGATPSTGSRRPEPVEPQINVTPLVDVVLVLLIIFMVIAPQLEHGQRVELPAVFQPDAKARTKLDPITVTVTGSGALFLEKDPLSDLAALRLRLVDLRSKDPERRVVIKGDGSLPYKTMREAFALCQDVGFSGIALSVSQRGAQKAGPDEG